MFNLIINVADVPCMLSLNNKRFFNYFVSKYKKLIIKDKKAEFKFNIEIKNSPKCKVVDYSLKDFTANLEIPQRLTYFKTFNFYFKLVFANFFIKKKYGLLLHASSVGKKDSGYVFVGDKGIGKSTIFKKILIKDFIGLSDDVAIIRMDKNKPLVFCSPFYERHEIEKKNIKFPLKKIFFIKRGPVIEQKKLNFLNSLNKTFYHSYSWGLKINTTPKILQQLSIICYTLTSRVDCYDLQIDIDRVDKNKILSLIKERNDKKFGLK